MIVSESLHKFGEFFMNLARGCHVQVGSNVYRAGELDCLWFVKAHIYRVPDYEWIESGRPLTEWRDYLRKYPAKVVYDPDIQSIPQASISRIRKVEL